MLEHNRTTTPRATRLIQLQRGEVEVPEVLADRFRGLDVNGDWVVEDTDLGYNIPLTSCCRATGKGADVISGVVCRNCYREVDTYYGGPALPIDNFRCDWEGHETAVDENGWCPVCQ